MFLDKKDNIQSKQTEHGNYEYTYDDLYRLTTTDNPDFDDESYVYDKVGNRLASAETTGSWTYNDNNELGGYDDVSYEYDPNGNMVKKTVGGVVTSYVYNVEDRLAEVWNGEAGTGSLIAEYYYDPFGRRLWKDVSGTRTYFHYADEGLIGEFDSSGVEVKSYGYKPGSTWATDPLFMKVGSDYYFYQNDHLGTPQKLTSVSGAVVWSAKYGGFGKATIDASSTVTNNLRFPGQYEDSETGLHYNFHRYYDQSTGRYLRTDPIGLRGGINVFRYASNNPLKNIDYAGLREYNIIDLICPLVTPFQARGFRDIMRMEFEREYNQGMYECLSNYLSALIACEQRERNGCPETECRDDAELDRVRCNLMVGQWRTLSEEYSWGQALIDMYRFDYDETLDHYRERVQNLTID